MAQKVWNIALLVWETLLKIKTIPIDAFSMSTKFTNIWVNHNLILMVFWMKKKIWCQYTIFKKFSQKATLKHSSPQLFYINFIIYFLNSCLTILRFNMFQHVFSCWKRWKLEKSCRSLRWHLWLKLVQKMAQKVWNIALVPWETLLKIKMIRPIDAFSMSTKLINIWVNHYLILIGIVLGILVLLIIDLLLFLFLFEFEHTVALFGPELLTAGVICRDWIM